MRNQNLGHTMPDNLTLDGILSRLDKCENARNTNTLRPIEAQLAQRRIVKWQ